MIVFVSRGLEAEEASSVVDEDVDLLPRVTPLSSKSAS